MLVEDTNVICIQIGSCVIMIGEDRLHIIEKGAVQE